MPHLTLEISKHCLENQSSLRSTLLACHQLLVEQLPTRLTSCKSRLIYPEMVVLADGTNQQVFAHLSVKILAGRSDELKAATARNLQHLLVGQLAISAAQYGLQVSVEICDLDPSYAS